MPVGFFVRVRAVVPLLSIVVVGVLMAGAVRVPVAFAHGCSRGEDKAGVQEV